MPICLQCGVEIRLGGLCPAHAEQVATCSDVTAEQIVSRPPGEPLASLIDQWGNTHTLGARAVIGRVANDCTVAILHHSVSALHAQIELKATQGGWHVHDRGSLNGTRLNETVVRTSPVTDGDRLRFGDVSFFFCSHRLPAMRLTQGAGLTVPSKQRDLAFSARVQDAAGKEMSLVQRSRGGIVRLDEDTTLELARLEFALLQALAEKRMQASDPELAFMTADDILDALDFRGEVTTGDNVRELVRRVRRKLRAEGLDNLIESRQGVGYRLAWNVMAQ